MIKHGFKSEILCSLHLVRCENTVIEDVSIYGDFDTPNNDGIDIEDSNNTLITRCRIDTGDDAICPKSSNGPVFNLTATNCWIRTKSSAIKLGSASWFNFTRMLFDNITIVDSHRGLGFQLRDGGKFLLPFLVLMPAILDYSFLLFTTRFKSLEVHAIWCNLTTSHEHICSICCTIVSSKF